MRPDLLTQLLREVASGSMAVDAALHRLRALPFEETVEARIDHHRELRVGFPEVIYGAGKTPEQVADITRRMLDGGSNVLCTRSDDVTFAHVQAVAADALWHEHARCISVTRHTVPRCGRVAVLCAGTSDLGVAEEAAVCAGFFGAEVSRHYDTGVAGLQRLLRDIEHIREADVAIVVAGMEGALPSVVGGLVHVPIIAVPTSVGYGAGLGGLTALFGMLSSCASGVTVVNIDNGFGAAAAARRILQAR